MQLTEQGTGTRMELRTVFDSREEMLHEIMSVFEQPAFEERRASSRSD